MGVKISKLSEVDLIPLPKKSWSKMILTEDRVGAKKISMGVTCFKPGIETSMMIHDEEELAYVVQGKGKIKLENGEEILYETGDGIYISPRTPHSVINDSKEDVIMVACFSWPEYPPTKKV